MDIRKRIAKELHAQARRNYPRRAVTLKGLNDLYQADLVEMIPYARVNKGYKYIMTVIDCFSKYAYAIPVKNKTGDHVSKALDKILRKVRMKHLQTDNGKEYYNSTVRALLDKYGVNHYSTYSEKKASIVERFNRTLKNMMYRVFTEQGTYKWYPTVLAELVKRYNDTPHRTIGMRPREVNVTNEKLVLEHINKKTANNLRRVKRTKFNVGDKVRISKFKRTFTKGYQPNWTNEVFTVDEIRPTIPITYYLRDHEDKVIRGSFYEHELIKSEVGNVYLIEKVVQRKGDRVKVRWLGFDGTHDTWINKKDLV